MIYFKKILNLIIFSLIFHSNNVFAELKIIGTITDAQFKDGYASRDYINPWIKQTTIDVNSNFSDYETRVSAVESGKADKANVIRYWSDWPSASPGNTLAVDTIVAYDGELYKCTQEFVKTAGATPVGFTSYFTKITSVGGGESYTPGTGISIDAGVISSTVVDTDTFASWDKDLNAT